MDGGGGEAQSPRLPQAWPKAPRGGVHAARVRGRRGARRFLPRPGVCLPTHCLRSAATHSDALNKLPALAVWSRLPRRSMAAGSEPPCRSPTAGKRARRFPAPPPPQRLRHCAASLAPWSSQPRQLPRVSAVMTKEFADSPIALQPWHSSRKGLQISWAWSVRTTPLVSPGSEFP